VDEDEEQQERVLRQFFVLFDEDCDGRIDVHELLVHMAVFSSLGSTTEQRLRLVFKAFASPQSTDAPGAGSTPQSDPPPTTEPSLNMANGSPKRSVEKRSVGIGSGGSTGAPPNHYCIALPELRLMLRALLVAGGRTAGYSKLRRRDTNGVYNGAWSDAQISDYAESIFAKCGVDLGDRLGYEAFVQVMALEPLLVHSLQLQTILPSSSSRLTRLSRAGGSIRQLAGREGKQCKGCERWVGTHCKVS
jgi:hypothetical protein